MTRRRKSGIHVQDALDELAYEAQTSLGLSKEAAEEVARIARRNLSDLPSLLGPAELRRVSAYYRTVVRRRCMRAKGIEWVAPRARIILGAIRSDLRAGGWAEDAIEAEIASCFAGLLKEATGTHSIMPAA